jgi:LmbE family N-acetylglucosaminyl deacetylase
LDTKTALVIVAHADDVEFVCAGTVARWVREGWEVVYVVCTDSSKGSNDPDMSPQKLVQIRVEEQRRAAAVLGVDEVVFLGYEDGSLQDDAQLRRDLVRLIRRWKPRRVITGDPTFRVGDGYVNHPDHVAVASAACAAVYPFARNRPTFPDLIADGLEPHEVDELWLWSNGNANTWVDVEETLELKIKALREHKSQIEEWDPTEMIYQWARRSGAGQLMEYAEAFRVVRLAGG